MKKSLYTMMAVAVAAITMISCNKQEKEIQAPAEGYRYSFSVVDDVTKATLDNGGVLWEQGDQVGMFIPECYTGYARINNETNPKSVILFSRKTIPAGTSAYAYYPFSDDNGDGDEEAAKIVFANIQQGGSNSSMPMAGIPFVVQTEVPLEGNSAQTNGEIHFLNLGSIIDFKIFSEDYDDETVQYVTFQADNAVVSGDSYLDLTAIDASNATTLDPVFMGTDNEYNYVKVNQEVAVATDKSSATSIYMVIAPGTYSGTITIGTDVATYTFTFTNKELGRNVVKHYNMNLSNATRVEEVVENVKSLPYTESFTSNIGEFETDGVQVASTDVWTWGGASYGMKASARVNSTNYAAESWLTSPWIDLRSVSAAVVTFDHVHQYAGTATEELTFWVLTDESDATWQQVTIPTYAAGNNWTFVNSGEILLSSPYVGHKVKIGFKYISTTSKSATWEIKNVSVTEKVYTTEFTKDADAITVEVGKTKNNHVKVNSGATITYTSGDETIATVTSDGTVTGVAEGTTTIAYEVAANGLYPANNGSFSVTVVPAVNYSSFSWDLSKAPNSASENALTWIYRGVTMVTTKDGSTAANNYCPPAQSSTRFYKDNTLTITPYTGSTIGYVEFTATTAGYATALKNSTWANASATVDDKTVTVTPEVGTTAFSATIGGTCGFTAVTVYYTGDLEAIANYTVSFSQPTESGCSFTVSVGGSTITSGTEVASGEEVTLAATAGTDYEFTSWTVTDASNNPVTVSNNKFTMPSSNVTISATFSRLYNITCGSTNNGTISASAAKATAGTEITLTATPNSGYQLSAWTVTDASSNNVVVTNNKFTMPASNVTVNATFVAGKTTVYTLTPNKNSGNSAYATYYDVTINGVTWNAPGNQAMDNCWRIGGKDMVNVPRTIYGKDSLSGDVDEIVIATDGITNANLTVNSITVTAHETATDAASGTNGVTFTTSDDMSFAVGTAKSVTFTKSGSTDCSGYYYRIVFNFTNKSTSKNYGLDLTGITFYKN